MQLLCLKRSVNSSNTVLARTAADIIFCRFHLRFLSQNGSYKKVIHIVIHYYIAYFRLISNLNLARLIKHEHVYQCFYGNPFGFFTALANFVFSRTIYLMNILLNKKKRMIKQHFTHVKEGLL